MVKKMRRGLVLFALVGLLVGVLPGIASAATMSATIDFEGLAEGAKVTSLSSGAGISGDAASGSVGVSATGGSGDAMIFDSNCAGAGCSGGDADLGSNTGNVLIVSEDGDSTDPDDNADAGSLAFDLSGFGPGTFEVVSLVIVDFGDETAAGTITVGASFVAIPDGGGDGNVQTVPVGLSGSSILVASTDSYSVDSIVLRWRTGGEGCTPGYYKNTRKHGGSWIDYAPGDDFDVVFGVDYEKTLLEALNTGGGAEKALGRHAVAALLNASNPDVDYEYSAAQVIAKVQNAWATGDYEAAKNALARQNETGCPVGNTGPFTGPGG